MQSVGRSMTMGVTLLLAILGGTVLTTAANFEHSMNRVENLTGATGKSMAALTEQARKLGATTQFSASEAAEAMGFLGMAGFSTKQIMDSMAGTLDLAAASGLELGQTADIASNILTGFRLEAEQMGRVADVMTMTMQSTNTNMEQLGEGMKFVAPVAAGMKLQFEEVSAAMGLLGNAGIQASMAGTTLRGALTRIASPARAAVNVLNRLGIKRENVLDAQGNLKSIAGLLQQLERAGATTTDMLEIFGQRAGPGLTALMSQGSAKLVEMTQKLEGAGGAAKKAADVNLKGLGGQLKILKSTFEEFGLAIADSGLLMWATELVRKAAGLFRKLSTLSPALLKIATVMAIVAAAVGPLLMILGGLIVAVGTVGAHIAAMGGIIALISNPIGWVVAGILALIAIITYMTTHTQSKMTKILTYLFPLAGLVTWIISRWSRLLPFFKLVGFVIGGVFKGIWWVVGPIVRKIGDLLAWVGGIMFKTLDLILSIVEGITRLVLPKWLEKKIGLTTEVTGGAGAADLLGANKLISQSAGNNINENKTSIVIQNKTDAKVRTSTDKGAVSLETYFGPNMPAFGVP